MGPRGIFLAPTLNRRIQRIKRHPVDEMERFVILKQDVHTVTTVFKWLTHLFTLVYFVMLTQLHIPTRMMSINGTLRSTRRVTVLGQAVHIFMVTKYFSFHAELAKSNIVSEDK